MLVLLHPLRNIEITKYFNYELSFNGAFSKDNLTKIKDVAYVKNLEDIRSKGTHYASLFIDKNITVPLHKKY